MSLASPLGKLMARGDTPKAVLSALLPPSPVELLKHDADEIIWWSATANGLG